MCPVVRTRRGSVSMSSGKPVWAAASMPAFSRGLLLPEPGISWSACTPRVAEEPAANALYASLPHALCARMTVAESCSARYAPLRSIMKNLLLIPMMAFASAGFLSSCCSAPRWQVKTLEFTGGKNFSKIYKLPVLLDAESGRTWSLGSDEKGYEWQLIPKAKDRGRTCP